MSHTKEFKNGWQIGVYKYNNGSFAVFPYLNIGRYKYQGDTSIGCLKWNITFGWIVFGFFANNKYKPLKVAPKEKLTGKPFNIFDKGYATFKKAQ